MQCMIMPAFLFLLYTVFLLLTTAPCLRLVHYDPLFPFLLRPHLATRPFLLLPSPHPVAAAS